MNKFHIKAGFKDKNVSSYLIRSFFFDFNSEGNIDIKDGKVEISLFCEDVPMEIIDTITYYCIVEEFHMSQFSDKSIKKNEEFKTQVLNDAHVESESETSEEDVNVRSEFKIVVPVESLEVAESDSAETKKVDNNQSKKGKAAKKANRSNDDIDIEIPELKEFLQKSSTFEEFSSLVAKWINFGNRNDLFIQLAVAATHVENVTWRNLSDKVYITQSDKQLMAKSASTIFKKYSLTMLPFLKILVKYNNYFSSVEEKVSNNKVMEKEETSSKIQGSEHDEKLENVSSNKANIRMHCLRLDEALENIDKTQPITERVNKILSIMSGGDEIDDEISIMVNAAISLKVLELNLIFRKTGLNSRKYGKAWMKTSTFINNFVQESKPGLKIKAVDFLKELQSSILTEEELRNL